MPKAKKKATGTLNALATTGTAFHIHGVTARGIEFQNPRVHSDNFAQLLHVYGTMIADDERPPRELYLVETDIRTREMIRYVAAYNPKGVN